MSLHRLIFRQAIVMAIAACCTCQVIADGGKKADLHVSQDGLTAPSAEKREAGSGAESVDRNDDPLGSMPETKGGDRKKADQRDVLLILLLQILRSPK